MRIKILCNMERCRWRQYDNPWQHEKYVVVNIPSFLSLIHISMAQYMWQEEDGTEKIDLREDIQYGVEMLSLIHISGC